jgi:hypothetical protein
MADSSTTFAISPYRKGGLPLKFDMAQVFSAESRMHEISFAGKIQSKDLFATFTRAYIYVSNLHAMVKLHVARASTEARKRRAVLIIDHIPGMAKEKGLATSRSPTGAEDIREAFLYKDEEYLLIEEGRAALEAAEALLFGKMMAFREAADACKQMLSPDERPRLNNAELTPNAHGMDEKPLIPHDEVVPPPKTPVTGFGEPQH